MTALTEAQRATLMQVGGNKLELNLKMHIYFTKSVKIMLVLKITKILKSFCWVRGECVASGARDPFLETLGPALLCLSLF